MGRSRGKRYVDDSFSPRSRRTRATCTAEGQATNEGKRALYHCNYCNKDISGKIRIKCAQCPDFDLCVECFSVGAEVTPHKSDHPYRVMDSFSFPLICPDWNADEEILLLEGIEMYGLESWAENAEHVGTKRSVECIDHYTGAYLNSPHFPLPDMSHVAGKNRDELLAMAKEHDEHKKDSSVHTAAAGTDNKASDLSPVKDEKKDSGMVSNSRVNMSPTDEGTSLIEMSGYNLKRKEFNAEYDNNAEQLIADIHFKDSDTKVDRELKLRMLHIYNQRLDERERRKEFVLERNLLYSNPLLKDLSLEEKQIYHRLTVFMRFHSKEEHEEMIRTVIEEHRIRKRIRELQEARHAGCRTSGEADTYLEQKRRAEPVERAHKAAESIQVGPSREPTVAQASSSSLDDWDIKGLPGLDLLSENEKQLCCETRMLPYQYLKMQEIMSKQIFIGNISKKSDAYRLFRTDPNKVDRVYDVLVRKGVAYPS